MQFESRSIHYEKRVAARAIGCSQLSKRDAAIEIATRAKNPDTNELPAGRRSSGFAAPNFLEIASTYG